MAMGLKPRTISSNHCALNIHILPAMGELCLHEITQGAIAAFRAQLLKGAVRGPKTVNNVLSVLSRMLKCAVEWGHLHEAPRVKQVKCPRPEMRWYADRDFERLVKSATSLGVYYLAAVLLAGDAGLRAGEILGLEFEDIEEKQIRVQRSVSKGHCTSPKGGRGRSVPMTKRLRASLNKLPRGLARGHLFCDRKGQIIDEWDLRRLVWKSQKRAGLPIIGVHALRHTFCSRLAGLGVDPYTIQHLAGHQDIATTMRYIHRQPGAAGSKAIRSLGV